MFRSNVKDRHGARCCSAPSRVCCSTVAARNTAAPRPHVRFERAALVAAAAASSPHCAFPNGQRIEQPEARLISQPVISPQYLRAWPSWLRSGSAPLCMPPEAPIPPRGDPSGQTQQPVTPGSFAEDMRRRRAGLLTAPPEYYDEERTL